MKNIFCEVTSDPLDISRYVELVADPGAGAISTFTGVTRNNFQGKTVIKLDYEAYTPMALKKLQELAHQVTNKWSVCKVAIAHRVGTVLVGEPSVIIAVSSAHRRESLEAVHWAIDELKASVPIWKKEFFEDGSVWKENEESRRLLAQPPAGGAVAAAVVAGAAEGGAAGAGGGR
ncbi:hypothetical protein CHLRE_07g322250v5 [Chlamydomonas reinhardtii]|uniref:Molybdopterin synthase catalytic subunit n=1 Tax=Chlamydomonas reinhardtii TaxID=3055 RepID=A0A2K3DJ43_CHLRE|nr:molybdopterin synthase [Chlamydomonas reinhardtii]PNW80549.1 hypothetical protein CHLRE_07g322250v5 [Chlamydomonas reinhardtii]